MSSLAVRRVLCIDNKKHIFGICSDILVYEPKKITISTKRIGSTRYSDSFTLQNVIVFRQDFGW